jgi:hypothetical protein
MFRRLALVGAIATLAIGLLAPAAMAGGEKVTICHKPGTKAEGTLVVAAPAVDAHLAHGDALGDCGGSPPVDGCIALGDPEYDGLYQQGHLNGLVFGTPGPGDPEHYWLPDLSFRNVGEPYGNPEVTASWLPGPASGDQGEVHLAWPPVGEVVSISWRSEGQILWSVDCYDGY